MNESRPNDCVYFLSKDRLLAWKGWDAKAKTYVARGDVNLLESIQAHAQMVDEAYNSLLSIFPEIHSADIDAVNELIHQRNDILSGKIPIVDVDD